MNNKETPLALRLADNLAMPWTIISDQQKAAAELRRLDALNAELVEACETLVTLPGTEDWIATLRLAVQQSRAALAYAAGAADMQERCAKACEARYMGDNNREDQEARRCAAAIRAMGDDE